MTDFSTKKFRELNDAYKSMYAPAPVEEETAVEEVVDSETEVEYLPDLVENLPGCSSCAIFFISGSSPFIQFLRMFWVITRC